MLYGDIASRLSGEDPNEIDAFNRASLDYYSGDTAGFTIVGTPVFEGSGALESDTGTANNFIGANDASGIPGTISQGDSWSWRASSTVSSGGTTFGRMACLWAIGDITNPSQDHYYIDLRPDANRVQLAKNVAGTATTLAKVDYTTYTAGEWPYIEATWGLDDTISFDVYEPDATTLIGSASATDTSHTGVNGTVGWYSLNETGDQGYADDCRHL